jgi:hypothetical protein
MGSGVDIEKLLIFAIAWCWVALPCFAIVGGWRAVQRSTSVRFEPIAVLLLVAVSYSWILVGIFFPGVIGPHYSSRRLTTICANMIVMVILALWAVVRGRDFRRPLLIASLVTATVWFYVLAASSVV